MKVTRINTDFEVNDTNLKNYLAECSSVVRQKQPKDADRLFNRLLKESYGNTASRVFEYIPCTIRHVDIVVPYQFFGFFSPEKDCYYTNARELLNLGWGWEDVIDVVDFTYYRAVQIVQPYFLYGQGSTHTQITTVSHSARYTESNLGYWYPEEFIKYCNNSENIKHIWNDMINNTSPSMLKYFMKNILGVNRKEIYNRGADMLQYRTSTYGGYINNPNSWEHFINQRLNDSHTQKEMREVAQMIKDKIYD